METGFALEDNDSFQYIIHIFKKMEDEELPMPQLKRAADDAEALAKLLVSWRGDIVVKSARLLEASAKEALHIMML